MKNSCPASNVAIPSNVSVVRTAVGYVRVSTDMQANDGLSLDAQRAAIQAYCSSFGLQLVRIFQDVESGGKADRKGLAEALAVKADVVVVLKFDRLSRSIKHFCELYEQHFSDGSKELVAIREAIRLDSALGRALVSILLVFAQMEREATGERTREAINHIRKSGYHFGKVPYGHKTVPAVENPRYRVLVDEPAEQEVLAKIKALVEQGRGLIQIANQLTAENIAPPQGVSWTKSLIYNLKVRRGWHVGNKVNERTHTDEEAKLRMKELRDKRTTYQGIANILNETGYLPYKGKKFTELSIRKLLGNVRENQLLTPKQFCESQIHQADGIRPSYPTLAQRLKNGGFLTPKGNTNWWPAQVQQLLGGAFDGYYKTSRSSAGAGAQVARAMMEPG